MDHEIVVIGGGFSGIGAAIALDRAGFDDLVVLEAGDGVGGAWHWNTYPGVAVDIPSFSYQFSYAQSAEWSRVYAPGDELKAYAEECVDRFGIRDRIRLNSKVTATTFDGELWTVALEDGTSLTARYVVTATGVFTQPKPPDIDGLETFGGVTVHTARWDHDIDLAGKRVGVIGTGASAVQVIPAIADQVEHLTVFQRTPIWCLPKLDAAMPSALRTGLRRVPGARALTRLASQAYVEATFPLAAHFTKIVPAAAAGERVARSHLRKAVRDPEVREKLTPTYALGCKRPSFSNTYLQTFDRDDVTLETAGIVEVTADGVVTESGDHALDVLVLATGFKVFERGNMPSFPVTARGVDLEQWWGENRFQAYQGVSVPGFPNLFSILGPYGYNGSSYFNLIETQMNHIVRLLRHARRNSTPHVEVTSEANERYWRRMLSRRGGQVFFQGGCGDANSYYFDEHGDVPFRPSTTLETMWTSRRFDLDDYRFEAAS